MGAGLQARWLDETVLQELLGSRDAELFVYVDCIAPVHGGHSAALLDMLHGTRLRAATAGTNLTVVLVTPGEIDTAAMHRVETLGFQPNRLVAAGTAGHLYGNKEDVAIVVVCPSLTAFDEMGFIPGTDARARADQSKRQRLRRSRGLWSRRALR